MRIEGWILVDEAGVDVMATKVDSAWATINEAGGYPSLDVRHCDEAQRATVPVAVVEALLAAWRRKQGP